MTWYALALHQLDQAVEMVRSRTHLETELDRVNASIEAVRAYLAKPGARRDVGRTALAVARRRRRMLRDQLRELDAEIRGLN